MKTIEERAYEHYPKQRVFRATYQYGLIDGKREGYIKGATEQRQIDEDAIHAIVEEQVIKSIEKQIEIDILEMKKMNEEWKTNLDIQRKMLIDKAWNYIKELYPSGSCNLDIIEKDFFLTMEE